MKIAYISYEHPLGISGGGIGTYLGQVARLMANRGHRVEVFTAHQEWSGTLTYDGYLVHRVKATTTDHFKLAVTEIFSTRHLSDPFDLIEAAEYGADALLIKENFLTLPLVVKLHTPSYLTHQLNEDKVSLADKARFYLGGLARGKISKPFWIYRKERDLEYQQYCLADAVCSPSESLSILIKEQWPTEKKIAVIPNPFVPAAAFLNSPVAEYSGGAMVVSFFGRLEKRKGILELAKAIPFVLKQNKDIIFQFVGKSHPSPEAGIDMETYLKKRLKKWAPNLRFLGHQSYDKVPHLLAGTQVCIFPSLWENFPNVCLEAMSAGRAVIASANGGMGEMIRDGVSGLLINPEDTLTIANAILRLSAETALVSRFGLAAREKVMKTYNEEVIGDITSEFYTSVINTKLQEQVSKGF